MDDKRRRARVQGAWAAPPGKNLQGLCGCGQPPSSCSYPLLCNERPLWLFTVFFRNTWHLSDLVDGELRALTWLLLYSQYLQRGWSLVVALPITFWGHKSSSGRFIGSCLRPFSLVSATSGRSHLPQTPGQAWRRKQLPDREFVFKEPQLVVRAVPEPRVIDREGVHEISLSPTGVSRVCLYPGFVDLKEADWILERLCQDVPWKQRMGIKEDITYPQPRLTAWYGELPYTYSRITMEPNPQWHPVLCTLKSRIEENTGHTFNSLLCNLYRDEKDSVDWHSDDEPSLGSRPVIASLSFGATRTFEMRKKPPPEENGDYTYMERVKIPLDHGTLLIMEGATQADWQHRVPKEYHSREPRVNLTFRTIYPDPRGAPGDGTCPQGCH